MPTLSRRQMLTLGALTAACSWGGIGLLTLLFRAESEPIIRIVTPEATPLPAPPMIPRAVWGALPPNHEAKYEAGFYSADNPEGWRIYEGELHEVYQTVVVHHSVIYDETDPRTLLAIQTLHRETRQWADVAYHFFVGKNGLIYEGRDWSVRGTHVGGYNTGSIGVCLLGNFMEQEPPPPQIDAAQILIKWLALRLQLSHIAGHRDFNAETDCPGDNVYSYIAQFGASADLQIGIDGYLPPDAPPTCACCDCGDA